MLRFLFCIALFLQAAHALGDEAKPWPLFDGVSLDGWTFVLDDANAKLDDVWKVEEGVIKCKGNPAGYLVTEKSYENYKLVVEWRWPDKGGNNGVLVHCTEKHALGVWPKCLEVQLGSGDAGDFWVIGTTIKLPEPKAGETPTAERIQERRHINLTDDSEKSLGEWNTMEIVCRGNRVTVSVNGVEVNECFDVSQSKGQIALQSEGTPIEYRKVELTLLEPAAN